MFSPSRARQYRTDLPGQTSYFFLELAGIGRETDKALQVQFVTKEGKAEPVYLPKAAIKIYDVSGRRVIVVPSWLYFAREFYKDERLDEFSEWNEKEPVAIFADGRFQTKETGSWTV